MLSKAELKRIQALKRRKSRAERRQFLAEGIRVVDDLLASPIVPQLALIAPSLEDTPRGAALARRLRDTVRTEQLDDHVLADIADTETPQGVVVIADMPHISLAALQLESRALIVVLDAVQDPGNFGTIVRSADAFGAAAVIALPGTVDPWNAKAVRAAAGSSLRLPVVETDLETMTKYMHTHRVVLYGADMSGQSIERIEAAQRSAVVLGNEGGGLTPSVRAACDELIAVPIRGSAESLNVGVAAGILLYMMTRAV
jgi:TrmH family RNA methyltransferase